MITSQNKRIIVGIFILVHILALVMAFKISQEILIAYKWFTVAILLFIDLFFFIKCRVKKGQTFSFLSLLFFCLFFLESNFQLTLAEKTGLFNSLAANQQLILVYVAMAFFLLSAHDAIKVRLKIFYPFLGLSIITMFGALIFDPVVIHVQLNWLPVLTILLLVTTFLKIKNNKHRYEYFLQFWFLLFVAGLLSAQVLLWVSYLLSNPLLIYAAVLLKGASYIVVLCGIFFRLYKILGKSELQANNLSLATEEVRQEIEERRWAEELLNESRLFSESIVESISEPLLVLDSELKIIRANKSFYTTFKLKPKQTINRSLKKIGKGELNIPDLLDNLSAVLNQNTHLENFETIVRINNKVKTILINARRIAQKDIHTNLLILTINDITDLKTAREHARLLASGVESALEAIILTDQTGAINYVNPAYLNLTSFSLKELKGRKLYTLINDLNESDFKEFIRNNDSGNKLWTKETVGYKKDGSPYDVYVTIAPVYDKFHRLEGFVSIHNNITELKKAKVELAQRAAELARSNAELEQFAYVASHDLQEPLRMVSSFCQLLKKRYYDKLDSDANDFIDFAVDGAKRMQTLISDLLLYSRVGTRGKPFVKTDCHDIIAKVLKNLKISIEDSNARILVKNLPTTVADETQLVQLFQNLIGNALKFRNSKSPEIIIDSERENGHWLFSITDNGIGIEPIYQNKIFTIFQRLEGTGNYEGTGIGLAICKKIVERHHGKIWLKSNPGEGSTFYFTLPALQENNDAF